MEGREDGEKKRDTTNIVGESWTQWKMRARDEDRERYRENRMSERGRGFER